MSAKRKYLPVEASVPPKIGEIRRIATRNSARYVIWSTCVDCGKARWVRLFRGKPDNARCRSCMYKERVLSGRFKGSNSSAWRGGRRIKASGYAQIKLPQDSFFYPMATKQGYVLEHRLVMAQYLHRCLLPWEIVHHKGTKYPLGSIENKSDNRIENLQLLPSVTYHIPSTRWQEEVNKLNKKLRQVEARITLIEADNVMLRKELEDKAPDSVEVKI